MYHFVVWSIAFIMIAVIVYALLLLYKASQPKTLYSRLSNFRLSERVIKTMYYPKTDRVLVLLSTNVSKWGNAYFEYGHLTTIICEDGTVYERKHIEPEVIDEIEKEKLGGKNDK